MLRNRFVAVAVATAFLIVIKLVRDWRRETVYERDIEVVLYATLLVVFGLVVVLVFLREELAIADGVLTRRNMLGLPRRYPLGGIGGMVRRDVTFFGRPAQYVVVYDRQNRCLFKMNRPIWDPADVRRLHAIVGGDWRTQIVTMAEVEKEFPGSVGWLITHPWVLIALELAGLVLVILVLVNITDALTSRFYG